VVVRPAAEGEAARERRRPGGRGGRLGQAGAGATTAMWRRRRRRRRREGQAEEPRVREGLAGAEEGGGRRLKMNSARKIHHRQIFIRW